MLEFTRDGVSRKENSDYDLIKTGILSTILVAPTKKCHHSVCVWGEGN